MSTHSSEPLPVEYHAPNPFETSNLTGPDQKTGLYLDSDPSKSSILLQTDNTNALYIDRFQNMGINTVSPSAQLDINSASGKSIQLTYNNTEHKANIGVSSDGKLSISTSGSEVVVDDLSSFNIRSHNGLSKGLILGDSLVKATASQLNFNVVTAGEAARGKALVLNEGGAISGILSLSADTIVGTLATPVQHALNEVLELNIKDHNGSSKGLKLNNAVVTSTAEQLNYVNTTEGQAVARKALIVDSDLNIRDIATLTTNFVAGTLLTATQLAIERVGTLKGLTIDGSLTGLKSLSIDTQETGRTLVLNSTDGNCLRLTNNADTESPGFVDLLLDTLGNLRLHPSGGDVNISTHNGIKGLKLGGTLVQASADDLNFVHGVVPGMTSSGKALVVNSALAIRGIKILESEDLYGTIQTPDQPGIKKVQELDIAAHNGGVTGLKLASVPVTATAVQLNYVNVPQGTAVGEKALVLDTARSISNINHLTATALTGTLQTIDQPNIERVGTLDELKIKTTGTLEIGNVVISKDELDTINDVTSGTAKANKALIVNADRDIVDIRTLGADAIFGVLQTPSQPNIEEVSTLNITVVDKTMDQGLKLGGILVTSTAEQINYVDTTEGTAVARKALVLDVQRNITNIASLTAASITGSLATADQSTITKVGRLDGLAVGGNVTVGQTTLEESEFAVLDGAVAGFATLSKALIVGTDRSIANINALAASSVTADDLFGTIKTAVQPHITQVNTLNINSHDGEGVGLSLGGVPLLATADQLNSIFGAGGEGTFQKLNVTDTLTLANGTDQGLILGSTLVTASGEELNYIDGSVKGTVVDGKAVVVNDARAITGFTSLTSDKLFGSIETVDQPKIKSVGLLDSLSIKTDGTLAIGTASLSSAEIGVLDSAIPGTATASKALVLDSTKSITGIESISTTAISIAASGSGGLDYTLNLKIGTGGAFNLNGVGNIAAYSPTLKILVQAHGVFQSENRLIVMENTTNGYTRTISPFSTNDSSIQAFIGIAWSDSLSKFVLLSSDGNHSRSLTKVYVSANGINFTFASQFTTNVDVSKTTQLTYHPQSGHVVFFNDTKFFFSTNATTWNSIDTGVSISNLGSTLPYGAHSTSILGSYVMGTRNGTSNNVVVKWNSGTQTWSFSANVIFSGFLGKVRSYNESEDRLYMVQTGPTASVPTLVIRYIDNLSTVPVTSWDASTVSISYSNISNIQAFTMVSHPNYGTIISGPGTDTVSIFANTTIRVLQLKNKELVLDFSDGGSSSIRKYGLADGELPPFLFHDNSLVFVPTRTNAGTLPTFSTPTVLPGGITFGTIKITEGDVAVIDGVTAGTAAASKALVLSSSKTISGIETLSATTLGGTLSTATQPAITTVGTLTNLAIAGALTMGAASISSSEIGVLDGVVAGTVAASKALVVNEFKDISELRNLSAVNLTGTLQTANQPNVSSVNVLNIAQHNGSTAGLSLGGSIVKSDATELNYLEDSVPGVVVPGRVVVASNDRDISTFRHLSSETLTSTVGSLTMATTTINESEIAVLDDAVAGTATAGKALVVDASKDIGSIRNLSADSLTSTVGSLTLKDITINDSEIAVLDNAVAGTATEGKALVVDAFKDIGSIRNLSADSLTSTVGSLTLKDITISDSEIAVLDSAVAGTASAGKALVVDSLRNIENINVLKATELFGLIKDADQSLITSVGDLVDLTVAGPLTLQGTTLTGVTASYVSKATPGTAVGEAALVVDESRDIANINSLTAVNVIASNLTGTIRTSYQPDITSVDSLRIIDHNGIDKGLTLGDTLLTATAAQINSIFNEGGEGTFENLKVGNVLTLVGGPGKLKIGTDFVTASAEQLNYVHTTEGAAVPRKALVVDVNRDIIDINHLTAVSLTGTLQTSHQPNVTTVNVLDILSHDGVAFGLKLGGTLLTATAAQINSIFGAGGEGRFQNLTINDVLTLSNEGGLKLGGTFLTASGTELNYLDGSIPGTASIGNALVLDQTKSISGIETLNALTLGGTLSTAAQPAITSVGRLVDLSVAGPVTVGTTVLEESDLVVLDQVTHGIVKPDSAVIVDTNKSIVGFESLSANSLIALTGITGTLLTNAQPNIKTLGELTRLDVKGDAVITGSLTVGGTVLMEGELKAIDEATPGVAQANKALITDNLIKIRGLAYLESTQIDGTLMTTSQPNIKTLGELTRLDVKGDAVITGSLTVGGTVIMEGELKAIDEAIPGTAQANKALITNQLIELRGLTYFQSTSLEGTIVTAAQPNIKTVSELDITSHNGDALGLKLGGVIVTATASELNYVDTTVGIAQMRKALVLDDNKDIKEINVVDMQRLTTVSGDVSSTDEATSPTVAAFTVAGGVGIGKKLQLQGDAVLSSDLMVAGLTSLEGRLMINNLNETTSEVTGSITTAGGMGVGKSIYVGESASIQQDMYIGGVTTQSGVVTITNTTESTTSGNGALIVNGGVGIGKDLFVESDASISGQLNVTGKSTIGVLRVINSNDATHASGASISTTGGIHSEMGLLVDGVTSLKGNLTVTGMTTQIGSLAIQSEIDSVSTTSGALTTLGGVGIGKSLNVGGIANILDDTVSTSPSTGALVVAGGVGIQSNMNVADDVMIGGDLTASSLTIANGIKSSKVVFTHDPESTHIFEIEASEEYLQSKTGTGYRWFSNSLTSNAGSKLMELNSTELRINTIGRITAMDDTTMTGQGALVVDGGASIGKNVHVGANASIAGLLSVTGESTLTGLVAISNSTDSTSVATGALVVSGGVGIAKSLNVGINATIQKELMVLDKATLSNQLHMPLISDDAFTVAGGGTIGGRLLLGGALTVAGVSTFEGTTSVNALDESSNSANGAFVVKGGVGIAGNANVGSSLTVGATTTLSGGVTMQDTVVSTLVTDSTELGNGAIVTAGGVSIAKKLNVGGITSIHDLTDTSSKSTGALVVSGGIGVQKSLSVGGNTTIEGSLSTLQNATVNGVLTTPNLNMIPNASSPLSTTPLTTVVTNGSLVELNKDVGTGFIASLNKVIVVPAVITTQSVVYVVDSKSTSTSAIGLTGNALTRYNSEYSAYQLKINQISTDIASNQIWLAGSLFTNTDSIPIVLNGTVADGINALYTIEGASTSGVSRQFTRIAVAEDKTIVVVYSDGTVNQLYRMSIEPVLAFTPITGTGPFVSVAWLGGLNKFVATRNGTSAIFTSTSPDASEWTSAVTPSSAAPHVVGYNTFANMAVAVGTDFIWYSTNALTWTLATFPALTGTTFTVLVTSPVNSVFAIYTKATNTPAILYFSSIGTTWETKQLASGVSFGYENALPTSVAFGPYVTDQNSSDEVDTSSSKTINWAYSIGRTGTVDTIQRIGPLTSTLLNYGLVVSDGYLKNESAIGYEWYANTTATSIGSELMELTNDGLVVRPIIDVKNTDNSTSSISGSIVTSGGVGIAKNLNVGMDLSVLGDIASRGSFVQDGLFRVVNNTDSTAVTNGSIVTTGGIGISRALNVGTTATVTGSLSVGGASTLTGALSITNADDSLVAGTGSLITAGGIKVGKSLVVDERVVVGSSLIVNGESGHHGKLSVFNEEESTSTTTGSVVVSGGVGIAKSLFIGDDTSVHGSLHVFGSTSLDNQVSITDLTDALSPQEGALKVAGGVGITKSLSVGVNVSIGSTLDVIGSTQLHGPAKLLSTSESLDITTGALVIDGGVGIAKKLHVGSSASITGNMIVQGAGMITKDTDALSTTTGSLTVAGGVGIVKSLYVGSGIHGTIETASQPQITSVSVLNITGANGTDAGLSLAGELITANASELNYLHGSTPGTATNGKALVVSQGKTINGIEELSATKLFGAIQNASQPLITSVSVLNITDHDGFGNGLKLSGVSVKATANQINSVFDGTFEGTFKSTTITDVLRLSGANGTDKGLILGNTLVRASGDELNYLTVTQGIAADRKALVVDESRNIANINSLTASSLFGTIQTPAQPNITSVNVLNITGHNGSSSGLSLNGVQVLATAEQLNYTATTPGVGQESKALVLDSTLNIRGINDLTAVSLFGQIRDASQTGITMVGDLQSLKVVGSLTVGATVLNETDVAKIDGITNGIAIANKALVLNGDRDIEGINKLSTSQILLGAPAMSDLPLEVGFTSYKFTGSYAYNNANNAHGFEESDNDRSNANYSLRTDGRIICTGEIEITSDRRMKQNINKLTLDLSKKFIMTTTPVSFNWKTKDTITDYGYIAQDVLKAGFNDLVTVTSHPGMEEHIEEDGFVNPKDAKFVFSPGKIVPMLALNQRDVFTQLAEKDKKIEDLETRLAKLEMMFMEMQK